MKKTFLITAAVFSLLLLCSCAEKTAPQTADDTSISQQAAASAVSPDPNPPQDDAEYFDTWTTVPDPSKVCSLTVISQNTLSGLDVYYYAADGGDSEAAYTNAREHYIKFCSQIGLYPDYSVSGSHSLYVPCGKNAILFAALPDAGCLLSIVGTAEALQSAEDFMLNSEK